AHAAAARRGDTRLVRQEDEPGRRRARGGDADGLRRRGRGRAPVPGVRLARCPDRARGREVLTAPVRAGDGELRRPARRRRARRDQANGRIKASPLARRMARERGIELSGIRGTGPDGRIVAEDVERAEAGGPTAPPSVAPTPAPTGEVERIPLSNIRKTIARRLTEAWQIPVFQLQASADMTRVNALVARLRERDPDVRITVTDVLTKVCAQALMRHREVNAEFTEDAILLHPSANVGLAVAAPQGLIVPVIRSAERLSLTEIAGVRADLVGRAREAKLRAEDLEGGTFTISNLGMYAVESFTAVLNPPQAAIVAVADLKHEAERLREAGVEVGIVLELTGEMRLLDVYDPDGNRIQLAEELRD